MRNFKTDFVVAIVVADIGQRLDQSSSDSIENKSQKGVQLD